MANAARIDVQLERKAARPPLPPASSGRVKPRVLYLITRAIRGGAQMHVLELATSMRREYDVHLATGEEGFLTAACRQQNISVHIVSHLRRSQTLWSDLFAIPESWRLVRSLRPDLIHAHTFKAGLVGRFAGWSLGIPSIYTLHAWLWGTNDLSGLQRLLGPPLEHMASRWCEYIIAVSCASAEVAVQHRIARPEKIVTIHNGIRDCAEWLATGKSPCPVIMMTARFVRAKDHGLLIRAFAELQQQALLCLVGDGETRAEMESLADRLGIRDRVQFLGERADIPQLLASADIFVLASRSEMLPISILEAMRAGLPVVASNVGGVSEAVEDGRTGLLVRPGSVSELSAALNRLVADPALRVQLGRAARNAFLHRFEHTAMIDKHRELYQAVLQRRSLSA